MKKICIYMATHGPECKYIPDKCYPIEAGASIRDHLKYDLRDDSGYNISEKNAVYNELTALYWAWKNSDADIIGLYHYRRALMVRADQIEAILAEVDLIIPKKTKMTVSIKEQYTNAHYEEDFRVFHETLVEMYPDYGKRFDEFFNQNEMNFCNMFIADRQFVDDYCRWAFPLYEAIEEKINTEGRTAYQKRIIGFLSERAFGYYIYFNQFKTKEVPMKFVNYDNKMLQMKLNLAQYKIINVLYKPIRALKNSIR